MLLSQQKYSVKFEEQQKTSTFKEFNEIKEDEYTTEQSANEYDREEIILQKKFLTNIKFQIAQTSQILSYTHYQKLEDQLRETRRTMAQLNIEIRRLRIGMRNHIYTNSINFTFPIKFHNDQIKVKMPPQVKQYEMNRYLLLENKLEDQNKICNELDQKIRNLDDYKELLMKKYGVKEKNKLNDDNKINIEQNGQRQEQNGVQKAKLKISDKNKNNSKLAKSKSTQYIHSINTIKQPSFCISPIKPKFQQSNIYTTRTPQPIKQVSKISQQIKSIKSSNSSSNILIKSSLFHSSSNKSNNSRFGEITKRNNPENTNVTLHNLLQDKKYELKQNIKDFKQLFQQRTLRLEEQIKMLKKQLNDINQNIEEIEEIDHKKIQLNQSLKKQKQRKMNIMNEYQNSQQHNKYILKKRKQAFYKQREINKVAQSNFTTLLRGNKSQSPAQKLLAKLYSAQKLKLQNSKSSQNFILKNRNQFQLKRGKQLQNKQKKN